MTKIFGLLVTLSFILFSWNIIKAEEAWVYGIGNWDCGETISSYSNSDTGELTVSFYIQGFLSGMLGASNQTSSASGPAVIQETINYCKNNPLMQLHEAIYSTYVKILID